jgi:hypothetical protein
MQNAPPDIQQAHTDWNSFRRPATKLYVVVAVNTDIPQVLSIAKISGVKRLDD